MYFTDSDIRKSDAQGQGHYGAPRGSRKHNGVDIITRKNDIVTSANAGTVTKIGFPYNPNDKKRGHLRYVEVTDGDGLRARYFYVRPLVEVGQVVEAGSPVGQAQGLEDIYPGITDHFHFEVVTEYIGGKKIFMDPSKYIKDIA